MADACSRRVAANLAIANGTAIHFGPAELTERTGETPWRRSRRTWGGWPPSRLSTEEWLRRRRLYAPRDKRGEYAKAKRLKKARKLERRRNRG